LLSNESEQLISSPSNGLSIAQKYAIRKWNEEFTRMYKSIWFVLWELRHVDDWDDMIHDQCVVIIARTDIWLQDAIVQRWKGSIRTVLIVSKPIQRNILDDLNFQCHYSIQSNHSEYSNFHRTKNNFSLWLVGLTAL
jgi:hypothetical protein